MANNMVNPEMERISAADVENVSFLKENYTMNLPSLLPADTFNEFKITRNHFIGDLTLDQSIRKLRKYRTIDEYPMVFEEMTDVETQFLLFIATFKNVMHEQIFRQQILFPEIFGSTISLANKTLTKLVKKGFVQKYDFYHPIKKKVINTYSLKEQGYEYLRYMNLMYNFFNPRSMLDLPDSYLCRFWETVDVYQAFVSLPGFHDYSAHFMGTFEHRVAYSPLQFTLRLEEGKLSNLVIYPTLYIDGPGYYKNVISKWTQYVDKTGNSEFGINNLDGDINILTFYTATAAEAERFTKELNLSKYEFPIYFIIGSAITLKGVQNSIYRPTKNEEITRKSLAKVDSKSLLSRE